MRARTHTDACVYPTYTHTHTHAHTHTYISLSLHTHMYIYVYIFMCMRQQVVLLPLRDGLSLIRRIK